MAFELMNSHKFEIQTGINSQTSEPIYSRIAKGISSVEPANNEELDQSKYLDGAGFGDSDVIGAQLILTFTGHRFYGDPAQDFIFSKALELGPERRTSFRWTEPDGGIYEGEATIANISGPSGEAGSKGEISFEIHFNGRPTYTPPNV